MSRSLSRKLLIPTAGLILVVALIGAWVVSALLEQRLRANAKSDIALCSSGAMDSLTIANNLLSAQVKSSMQVLLEEAKTAGAPTRGPLVQVGSEQVPDLVLGRMAQAQRFELPDGHVARMGGTATLFSRRGPDFIRISTNVKKPDGSRAIGTRLDPEGKAIKALAQGQSFHGLVDILGSPYLTAYEPVRDASGDIIGALYVGYPIRALDQVAQTLKRVRILDSGILALLDQKGRLLFAGETLGKDDVEELLRSGKPRGETWVIERQPFEPWGFTLVAAYAEKEISRPLWIIRSAAALLALLLVGSLTLLLGGMVRFIVLRPIRRVMEGIQKRDLTCQLDELTLDEIGDLGRAYNGSAAQFRKIFHELAASSENVASGSTQMNSSAHDMLATASEIAAVSDRQRMGMNAVLESMDRMGLLVDQMKHRLEESLQCTEHAVLVAREGHETGAATAEAMEAIRTSSNRMVQAVELIQSIARQTNLLSLNAAIEAAKAGAQGKGFAVVADEVRKLAERSGQASKEIRVLIEEVDGTVEHGNQAVAGSAQSLGSLREHIEILASHVKGIVHSVREQVEMERDVRQHVDGIRQDVESSVAVSSQLSSTVGEMTRTSTELARVADQLAGCVKGYRI